jgi:L-rhamnose-H+ transport protein
MSSSTLLGLFWIFAAGVTQGGFPLPMKFTRAWKWEHLWFWYAVIGFFLLPLVVAVVTVPRLTEVYTAIPTRLLVLTALFGAAWGVGSVFFGLGLDALGMALGFPLMTALLTALGALIPMAVLTPAMIFESKGMLILGGNVVTLVGVAITSWAGQQRDQARGGEPLPPTLAATRSFPIALAIAIAAGVLSAMFNFGYAFGAQIMDTAVSFGASRDNAVNAMWLVQLPAGGVVNLAYCTYLMHKNNSWSALIVKSTPVDWLGAWMMAVLWTGSVILYGWGANDLGPLGPTLGWSLWNAILIATTVVCGLATREWTGAPRQARRLLYGGVAVLIAGMCVLGFGL